jgi:hypothetical protein
MSKVVLLICGQTYTLLHTSHGNVILKVAQVLEYMANEAVAALK